MNASAKSTVQSEVEMREREIDRDEDRRQKTEVDIRKTEVDRQTENFSQQVPAPNTRVRKSPGES